MHPIHSEFPLMELKFSSNENEMSFTGYGAVFGNMDSYGDVIQPGAFAKSLADFKEKGKWPKMLSQHGGMMLTAQDMTPIGVWKSLSEDGHGLRVEGKLADTPRGIEIYTLMKMKPAAIDELSIGYMPIKWTSRKKPEDPRRTLEEIKLIEVSPVTFAANDRAAIDGVKSLESVESPSDIERYLREVCGCSKAEAKLIVAKSKATSRREAADNDFDVAAALLKNINQLRYSI